MHEIPITIYRSVLLHHIGQIAYKEGFVINTGDDKARSDVQDVASDDETVARLTYSLDSAWGDILASLARVLKKEGWTGTESGGDTFTERATYTASLEKGDEYPRPVIESLTRAMHDYMVFYALAQWFAITKRDKVSYYETMAARAKDNITDYANRDYGPLHIDPWPPMAW